MMKVNITGLRSGLLAFGAALLSAGAVLAAPVQYQFRDFGDGRGTGSGVFTLDVGPILMAYEATGVVGSGPNLVPRRFQWANESVNAGIGVLL